MTDTANFDRSYPRPDFDRSSRWVDLNGEWQFARGDESAAGDRLPDDELFVERIVVPFPWESEASGIGARWLSSAAYRRSIEIPDSWGADHVVCFFGGVHHRCRVFVDEIFVAEHRGAGSFECDLTEALGGRRQASLVVLVDAPIDKAAIAHGKQRSVPAADYDSCSFRPTSGIWQSVWLEPRTATFLEQVRITTNDERSGFEVAVTAVGPNAAAASVEVALEGGAERLELTLDGNGRSRGALLLRSPRCWSPGDPHLYRLRVRLETADGIDEVICTAGLRTIEVAGNEIRLNGRRVYFRGVLDQGYWPDTGLTAPSVAALLRDLELAREAGYNLVRKHLKLEDRRWLHFADEIGMLVWEEPPSSSRYSSDSLRDFQRGIEAMVERDANHPCIVVWGCFNEEWGLDWRVRDDTRMQEALVETVEFTRRLDSTRPVVDNSGWSHVAGDLVDWHYYDEDLGRWRANVRRFAADLNAEIPVPLHPPALEMKPITIRPQPFEGRPNLNSEYGGGRTEFERGWHLRWQTQELRRHDVLSGYVYTELCDVEHEPAGIYDVNREPKDLGNVAPSDVNAETVLVLDVEPVQPGIDVITGDGSVSFVVRCSHHGESELSGELRYRWRSQLNGLAPESDPPDEGETAGKLVADPFRLTPAIRLETRLPAGVPAARLELWLESDDAVVVARSVLDVTRG